MSRVVHTNIWSAYGYARKAGYEGTEEEFEQGLKKSAEAAGNAEESASTASEAATEAEAARDSAAQSAENASTSEGNALEYANSAAHVLRDAQAVAQTVNANANEAAGSASRAENYAQTATTKASEATTAAGTATTAASSASGSAQAAEASKTAAAASETNAAASASNAATSAGSASESADDAAASAAEAQAVKDSIPADYSQLNADVTDLKSQISDFVDTPLLRNGSVPNGANTNAVATKYVVPISEFASFAIIRLAKDISGASKYRFDLYTFNDTAAGMVSGDAFSRATAIRRAVPFYEGENNYFDIAFTEEEKYFALDVFAYDSENNAVPIRVAGVGNDAISISYGIGSKYNVEYIDNKISEISEKTKNLADFVDVEETVINGVTWSIAENNFVISGQATAGNTDVKLYLKDKLPSGTYTLSFKSAIDATGIICFMHRSSGYGSYVVLNTGKDRATFTIGEGDYVDFIMFRFISSSAYFYTDNYIQIEAGNEKTEYIPIITAVDGVSREKIDEIIKVTQPTDIEIKNARHIVPNTSVPLTILHFSDLHADTLALKRIVNEAKRISDYIDDAICTGDMVANTAERISLWWDTSVMTCIGNHESASYNAATGYNWTALSMADRDAYYIAPFESEWGIVHTAGTSYYYKDYTTQKVRLIVMDAMLYSGTQGAEATAQTAWLANLLADAITNSYHVLIAIHAPHGGATAKECSFSRYGQGTMPTHADCNTPQVVIDTVATAISNGLHFIGYIVGHTHQDNIWDAEDDDKQLMYCVTCAGVSYVPWWQNSDQFRDVDSDAYNLVTIDTTNTLIKIVRGGGADIDDHMRTRKAICLNYSTGEVVGEVL